MSRKREPLAKTRPWLAPVFVALCTFIAFIPTLQNSWVTWDDDRNFLDNIRYRGFSASQLHWMWTTFHMGHYIPLSWMSLALDYKLWGLDARGYHLTNLLLHCVNAVLVYFLARRLLSLAMPTAAKNERNVVIAAAFAALFFAIHPLRVESVAWATERRDVLSGCFFWGAALAYLRYAVNPEQDRRWYWATLGLYALAMLSKATSITLPALLVLLNIYPLRRLGRSHPWRSAQTRRVLLEILPVAIISAGAIPLTIIALAPGGQLTFGAKLAVSAYSLMLYLWKTLLPTQLSPLYGMPVHVNPLEARFIASYLVVITLAVAMWLTRHRWPNVVVALLAFLAVVFPLLGIVQNGPQIAADRYTYHAAPALALVAGAVMLLLLNGSRATLARVFGAGILFVFGVLTWRQTMIWHDPLTFWNYVIRHDPDSPVAETALATLLIHDRQWAQAIQRSEHATRLDPGYDPGQDDLGIALVAVGRLDEAVEHFRAGIAANDRNHETHNNLGIVLAQQGKLAEAIAEWTSAISIKADYADPHTNWGNALLRLGRMDDAIAQYREAADLRPDLSDPQLNWGVALAQQGRFSESIPHFRAALTNDPDNEDARTYLDRATQLEAVNGVSAYRPPRDDH